MIAWERKKNYSVVPDTSDVMYRIYGYVKGTIK